jgi:hypothetical protein
MKRREKELIWIPCFKVALNFRVISLYKKNTTTFQRNHKKVFQTKKCLKFGPQGKFQGEVILNPYLGVLNFNVFE